MRSVYTIYQPVEEHMVWNIRTVARIQVDELPDKTFELVQKVLGKMKLKPKKIIQDKRLIQGKTKLSFIRNKFGQKFHIIVREAENGCVIDIYFDGVGITGGPDEGPFIRPFHEKFCRLVPGNPDVDVSLVDVSDEIIEESSNETVMTDNASSRINAVADEIAELSKMRSEGSISEEEFTRRKNDLIDSL